ADRLLAITISAQNVPHAEISRAQKVTSEFDVECRIVNVDILEVPYFTENPPDRCYHCKRALFAKIQEIGWAEGMDVLVDGTNADDVSAGDRPGILALQELGVQSPFADFDVSKDEIREAARFLGLDFAENPSAACLASRIPYNEPITAELLGRIEVAEEFLRDTFSLDQLRVRVHGGTLARIEVPAPDITQLADPANSALITQKFQDLGFLFVTLDLAGFRSGSLNAPSRSTEENGAREN
ncbi:MAG TPA: ATP-dependent sacrificial sulfur transferase LarE, partial [Candidatus Lokiarchaeia archaeon]|nr:ATP-dependent sacrificial sulfur transferase LarE [Candidatus Lokiarchaeia archaeon]